MDRISTGTHGLDRVLEGGLLPSSAYLLRGPPGLGKTTLGLQFLSAQAANETSLFIGFQESDDRLKQNARSIGLDVSTVHFLNLRPDEQFFTENESYDVFSSSEVEQAPIANSIVKAVESLRPTRVFVDSFTQLRFLTADVFQYRKQVLSFISFLTQREATVLFTSEHSESTPDDDLQFLADGVISLSRGVMGQTICVEKFRGSGFLRDGHQMRNGSRGVEVFPRPTPPKEELVSGRFTPVSTGIKSIDDLLHGGLEMGTVSMITGPCGIGKSTLSSCIAAEVARQLGHVSVYLFEEESPSYLYRAGQLGIGLQAAMDADRLSLEQIEPMQYLADEFANKVYQDVTTNQTRLVVFDSIAGFQLTLMEESVRTRLHALAKSLSRMNVSVLLINETSAMHGEAGISEKGISYLADNVIALSYDPADDSRATITVAKKRLSDFERRPHKFVIGPNKVQAIAI